MQASLLVACLHVSTPDNQFGNSEVVASFFETNQTLLARTATFGME